MRQNRIAAPASPETQFSVHWHARLALWTREHHFVNVAYAIVSIAIFGRGIIYTVNREIGCAEFWIVDDLVCRDDPGLDNLSADKILGFAFWTLKHGNDPLCSLLYGAGAFT
jgi:hypothetical protein